MLAFLTGSFFNNSSLQGSAHREQLQNKAPCKYRVLDCME
jgi:hypothetical protein